MKKQIYIYISIIIISLSSCAPGKMQPEEIVNHIESKSGGLYQEKNIGNYYFSAQYRPISYILALEVKRGELDKKNIENRRKDMGNMDYINFKIDTRNNSMPMLKMGLSDETAYFTRLQYFINGQDRFKLVEGNDTNYCKLYHFEQSYGLAPYNTIVLGFERKNTKRNHDIELIYDDQNLGTGPIILHFNKSDIEDFPELEY